MSDVFIGYFKFRNLCRVEGGLKAYGEVAAGVGWLTDNEWVARDIVAGYSTVPFARFRLDDGVIRDVVYIGGPPWKDSSYKISAVGDGVVKYKLVRSLEVVSQEYRIRKNSLALTNLESGAVVLRSERFVLTLTDPKNTLFGMSDVVECPVRKDEVAQIKNFLMGVK